MQVNTYSLGQALAMSVLLHGVLLAAGWWFVEGAKHNPTAPDSKALSAVLPPLPKPRVAPQPALHLPDQLRSARRVTPPSPPVIARKSDGAASSTTLVRQAMTEVAKHLLYPPEAVARGLEGDALVMIFLDESGAVVAARVERGSGHAILDQAAVAAARQVRSLPAAGVREVLLPVRFRLN